VSVLGRLSRHVREKSHESRSLYGEGELALIAGAYRGSLLCHDSSVRIEKFLEDLGILVVDMLYVILLEETLL
jgi:hypothetical protein